MRPSRKNSLNRRQMMGSIAAGLGGSAAALLSRQALAFATGSDKLSFEIERQTPARYFENGESWLHARCDGIPGAGKAGLPLVVLTMNIFGAEGSDVFPGVVSTKTDDFGKTWTKPELDRNLSPRLEPVDGKPLVPVAASDFYPKFHKQTGQLVNVGHTVVYDRGDRNRWLYNKYRERNTVYTVYDQEHSCWQPWRRLVLPKSDRGEYFYSAGAGSVQRYDLPNGEMLIPVYRQQKNGISGSLVLRCGFDGQTVDYKEHGNELRVESARGLGEPSLTKFGDTYYLTLRHDQRGYVATSRDGLHFDEPIVWKFDDGRELGNYNTQQHWATHSDGLFLVYNRRGADNDDIFRHRAPLFIAQVDPDRRVVIRETEKIVVPKRGAQLGNFGVSNITPEETWVTVAEAMRNPKPQDKADGSLWVARLHWNRQNRLV